MDLVMELGSGWIVGLILGMVTGMVVSLVLLKDSGNLWLWQSESQAKKLELYQVLVKKLESELAREKQKVKEQHLALGWDLQ